MDSNFSLGAAYCSCFKDKSSWALPISCTLFPISGLILLVLLYSDADELYRVKFIVKGTPQEVELVLPDASKSFENVADQCVILVSSVQKEFVSVMNIAGELLVACT